MDYGPMDEFTTLKIIVDGKEKRRIFAATDAAPRGNEVNMTSYVYFVVSFFSTSNDDGILKLCVCIRNHILFVDCCLLGWNINNTGFMCVCHNVSQIPGEIIIPH